MEDKAFLIYESAMARAERSNKRLVIIIGLLIGILFGKQVRLGE